MIRAALLLLILSVTTARGQDVVIRTSLDPAGPVVLGQPVALLIDVLFPGEMLHPPRIERPRVEGAQVFRFQSQGMTVRDRINETNYIGQRFELDIYPRRAGNLTVPPVQVVLLDKTGATIGTAQGHGLTIDARTPPGLDPAGPIVASTAVTMRETWEPANPETLHPGDALIRQITRTAEGVPGLAMANLTFGAPKGVRAYTDSPQINDRVVHGEVTGTRTDRVTYVLERAGDITLPAVSQPWWNLRRATAQTLTLPARDLSVIAPRTSPRRRVSLTSLIAAPVALLLVLVSWRIAKRAQAWRHGPRGVESAAFRALRKHGTTTDPVSTYRAWRTWVAARAALIGDDDPLHAPSARRLEQCVFGSTRNWTAADARQLLNAAAEMRKPKHHVSPITALPQLNG